MVFFILIPLTLLTFVAIFFSDTFIGILYFIAILIMIVFSIMDKKYGKGLTNHKMVFFLFDFKNYKDIKLSLIGSYQPYNAANVISAVELLKKSGISAREIARKFQK